MNYRGWTGFLSIVLISIGLVATDTSYAEASGSDGFTLEDFRLHTATDLVDVCTLEAGHEHYDIAVAFCYGFFEGATHYDDAISGSASHIDIVCEPPEVTRSQGVAAFVEYMQANPQYGAEPPIDAIFRALVDRWPCPE